MLYVHCFIQACEVGTVLFAHHKKENLRSWVTWPKAPSGNGQARFPGSTNCSQKTLDFGFPIQF